MPLPDVLCGPIVRRATREEVYVWLATSRRLELGVELYAVDPRRRPPSVDRGAPLGRGLPVRTVRLGQRLYVTLLRATPLARRGSFPARRLVAYDVVELAAAGDWRGAPRRRLGALVDLDAVTVGGLPLPCLTLQDPSTRGLRALTMSCRKLHGKGQDAARGALLRFSADALDPARRATALFLTGDQIYADDVAEVVAPRVQQLAIELQGAAEALPALPRPLARYGLGERQALVENVAGFTSGEAGNHLLTFGEFAAMYLLAWNGDDAIWAGAPASLSATHHAFGDAVRPPVAEWARRHREQSEAVARGREGSRAMRRLLANVPAYMIFDDHEVTDDWHLNHDWTRAVTALPLGTRVLSNGLAAYWAFQGWGNDPGAFPSGFVDTIEQWLTSFSGGAFDRAMQSHRAWSFSTPTTPPAWFTDARTGRAAPRSSWDLRYVRYNSARSTLPIPVPRPPFPRNITNVLPRARHLPRSTWPANLLGPAESQRMRAGIRRMSGPLITVAPAPVVGFEMIEGLQDFLARLTGSYSFDLEHWHANPDSLVELLTVLASSGQRRHLLLSGDVHYGFSARALFEIQGADLEVAQVTVSAAKNEPPGVMSAAGYLQSVVQLYQSLNVFDLGRYYWATNVPGSYHILVADEVQMIPVLAGAQLAAPALLRERVRFDNLGWSNAMNSNLARSNVGFVTFDGAQAVHRFTYVDDTGRMAGLPAQRYF